MKRFIGTDKASVELFLNIFISGTEKFVIPWDQLLYPVWWTSAAWDWNHCDTHLRLCQSENADADWREFLEVKENMEISGREVRARG